MVIALAVLSRADAEARLRERGLDPERIADVLASTHCTPPPSYLITTTALDWSWARHGTWDLRRAYLDLGSIEISPVSFRIGRQDLNFGDGRILGTSFWRSFTSPYMFRLTRR